MWSAPIFRQTETMGGGTEYNTGFHSADFCLLLYSFFKVCCQDHGRDIGFRLLLAHQITCFDKTGQLICRFIGYLVDNEVQSFTWQRNFLHQINTGSQ